MAATYAWSIAGVAKQVQPGWSHQATANGRNILKFEILSLDGSYVPALDAVVLMSEAVTILTSSVANPTVITTDEAHGLVTGQTVNIGSHVGSTPAISGAYTATVVSATSFSIPVNVTVGGTGGSAERRTFGGTVHTIRERGLGGLGVVPIITEVEAVEYGQIAERRYVNEVLLAGTLLSQLTTLATNYGFSVHPDQVAGPNLEALPCDYALLRDVLDQLSTVTGYVWEWTEFNYLRLFNPGTDVAPINVIDGDGHAIGDITSEPTRSQYANRVILRFSAEALRAYAFFTAGSANFGDGNTVTIGSQTYTFRTVLGAPAGEVLIGGTKAASVLNLIAAINHGAGAGTVYATATTEHASVEASTQSSGVLKAWAKVAGAAGNSIAVSTVSVDGSWYGEGGVAATTLELGADLALTNVSVANDAGEQAAHGIWEVVVQSPETTSATEAATLAAAYLAVQLVVPKTVTYPTRSLGLRPGQTQTITIASRHINNTFLITDVSSVNDAGNVVLHIVTATETPLKLNTAPRWRETYKQWSGGITTGATIGGGGVGGGVTVAGVIYGFGGSQTEWQQSPTPDWVSANSIQKRIDTSARGSLIATGYVRLRAASGSVTARLRNVSDGVTVGTSAAVASSSFQTVSFPVTLTAGSKLYEIQLLPSLAGVDCGLGSAYLE